MFQTESETDKRDRQQTPPNAVSAGKASVNTAGHRRRMLSGTAWTFIGALFNRAFAYVFALAAGRLLGIVAYGELAMIQATVILLVSFATTPLSYTGNRYTARLRRAQPERLGRVTGLIVSLTLSAGVFLAAVCALGAPFLSGQILNNPGISDWLMLAAFIIPLQIFAVVGIDILRGFEAFSTVMRINVVQGLVSLPAALVLMWFWGLTGAVLGLLVMWGLGAFITLARLRPEWKKNGVLVDWRHGWSERGILAKFSLAILVNALFLAISTWLVRAILVNSPDGYHHIGMFNAANQYAQVFLMLASAVSLGVLPVLADAWGKGDGEQLRVIVVDLIRAAWTILMPLWAVAFGMAPFLMLLFGRDFAGGADMARMLFLSFALSGVIWTFGPVLIAIGRTWRLASFFIVRGLVLLAVAWAARPLGAFGLALAYLASEISVGALLAVYLVRHGHLMLIAQVLRLLAVSLPGILLAVTAPWMPLWLSPLCGFAGGGAILLGVWFSLKPADREKLTVLVRSRMLGRFGAAK